MKTKYTIQDIFLKYGSEYTKTHKLSKEQWKVYNAIRKCKTKELGIHTMTCQKCKKVYTSFNSCRDRHCPMCQSYKREQWIEKQTKNLLNCPYFHIVTTVPAELNEIALFNQKIFYNILFKATSESILELANDDKWLGAKVGITSILHTWGSSMEFHPHIHSIVTGGGLKDNEWISSKDNYLFKVQVLSSLFRGKFLGLLKDNIKNLVFKDDMKHLSNLDDFNDFLRPLYNKDWITYIEPPKGSPENVIEYIGRYAFRVAISNNRIIDIDDNTITFEYKDYRDNGNIKIMELNALEFIRRFLLHVLPKSLTKIKHYGLLANSIKSKLLIKCRTLISRITTTPIYSNKKKRTPKLFTCSCGSSDFNFYYAYPMRS